VGIVAWGVLLTLAVTGVFAHQPDTSWIPQVASVVLALAWLLIDVLAKRHPIRVRPPYILLLGWILWSTVTDINANLPISVLLFAYLSTIKVVIISLIISNIVRTNKNLLPVYIGLTLIPLLLLGLFRETVGQLEMEFERGVQSDTLRLGSERTGSFGDSNENTLFASYGLISAVALFLTWKGKMVRWVALASVVPILTFIAYLGSRTGMASVPVLALAFWFFYLRDVGRRHPAVKLAGVLLMAGMLAGIVVWLISSPFAYRFSDRTSSYREGRGALAIIGLKMFASSPLIGNGTFGFAQLAGKYGCRNSVAHNTYVEMLVRGGLPGFLLYYSAWYLILRELWRVRRLPLSREDRIGVNMALLFCVSFHWFCLTLTLINPRVVWMTIGACIGYLYAVRERTLAGQVLASYEGESEEGSQPTFVLASPFQSDAGVTPPRWMPR